MKSDPNLQALNQHGKKCYNFIKPKNKPLPFIIYICHVIKLFKQICVHSFVFFSDILQDI